MSKDGKQLETLVAFIEKTLLPRGFDVTTNERVFNDDGTQIAEFDVEARGKIGSTDFIWLIECRDRPGQGPAPASWIEQLVGRRTRFNFNKVTAVSTTGFASGAVQFAEAQGIELREVAALNPDEFAWLAMRCLQAIQHHSVLHHIRLIVDQSESVERMQALAESVPDDPGTTAFLQRSKDGEIVASTVAFQSALAVVGQLFDDVIPNGPAKSVELTIEYPNDDDHFVVSTSPGSIRMKSILFKGEIPIVEHLLPLSTSSEYRHVGSTEPISQVATFAPQEICGVPCAPPTSSSIAAATSFQLTPRGGFDRRSHARLRTSRAPSAFRCT